MNKSSNKLNKIKKLAIQKRKEYLEIEHFKNVNVLKDLEELSFEIDDIIENNSHKDAFKKIYDITKEYHIAHKNELNWDLMDIESSVVELKLEIDSF